jgi:hypothetical protein
MCTNEERPQMCTKGERPQMCTNEERAQMCTNEERAQMKRGHRCDSGREESASDNQPPPPKQGAVVFAVVVGRWIVLWCVCVCTCGGGGWGGGGEDRWHAQASLPRAALRHRSIHIQLVLDVSCKPARRLRALPQNSRKRISAQRIERLECVCTRFHQGGTSESARARVCVCVCACVCSRARVCTWWQVMVVVRGGAGSGGDSSGGWVRRRGKGETRRLQWIKTKQIKKKQKKTQTDLVRLVVLVWLG